MLAPTATAAAVPACLIMRVLSDGTSELLEMRKEEILKETHERAEVVFGQVKGLVKLRDLRIVDPAFADGDTEPAIVVRMLAYLISMEEVRAIVLPDAVLLFIPEGGDSHLMKFRNRMAELASDRDHMLVPFELRAFECALSLAAQVIESELHTLQPTVEKTTKHAMQESSRVNIEILRDVRNRAGRMRLRALALRNALDAFLRDDRDMAMLQFSSILADPSRFEDGEPDEEWISHHDEVEMIVEAYLQQLDASISQLDMLELELNTVESNVMLQLDTTRNRLLLVETSIMALTAACGIGAMVAGIFGMNLNSGVQQADNWFWGITITLFAFVIVFVLGYVVYLIRRGFLIT